MIPSRGLRWSSQTIGVGRRRVEAFSARQFSSTVQIGPVKSNPLLSRSGASRIYTKSKFSATNLLIRNGNGLRFASTNPASTAAPASAPTPPTNTVSSPAASPSEITTLSLDDATDFGSDSLYNIPEHIGYLKSLGLDYGWGPTSLMEWTMEHIHIFAGTPWWISISLTSIAVRLVLFKPYVDAADNASKMAAIRHITAPLTAKMTQASRAKDTDTVMQIRQEMSLINKRAGIKLWKSFVPMLQIFAGYGTFVLLRAMAKLPVPGLETGGALWFHNLTIPDPYFLFPVATAAVLHWVLRRGGETGSSTLSPDAMKLLMYGLPILTVVFTWWLPAALQLSFFVAGLLSFAQASAFKSPAFRRYFNMYPLPSPASPSVDGKPATPYKGTMNVRTTPLTQAELRNAFQESRKPKAYPSIPDEELPPNVQAAQKALKEARNPWQAFKAARILQGAVKDVQSTFKEVKKSAEGMVGKGKESMDARKERSEREAATRFEAKRQEELKKERWERENERRAERAARKLRERK